MKKELGLYVHIPFCVRKCAYCDFPSFAGREDAMEAYVDRLIGEMKEKRDQFTLEDIQGKCAVLFTKKNLNKDFSRESGKTPKAPLTADVFTQGAATEASSRYGILPTKNH